MPLPQAFVATPTEGESFTAGPFYIVSRVQGGQSHGLVELYELTLGPSTIDYHVHYKMNETLAVLEGKIEFYVAGKKFSRLKSSGREDFIPAYFTPERIDPKNTTDRVSFRGLRR